MTDKERVFCLHEILLLVNSINNKIRELYSKGGECFISVHRDKENIGPSPVLHIDISDPGVRRYTETL